MAELPDQGSGRPGEPAEVIVMPSGDESADGSGDASADGSGETVEKPAKVLRIGSMIKQLLEEVRLAPLDEKSRLRMREIFDTSVQELAAGLSPDLREELDRLASPFDSDQAPSDAELRA